MRFSRKWSVDQPDPVTYHSVPWLRTHGQVSSVGMCLFIDVNYQQLTEILINTTLYHSFNNEETGPVKTIAHLLIDEYR